MRPNGHRGTRSREDVFEAIADARDSGYPALVGMQILQDYRERGFATASGKVELIPHFFERFGIDPRPTYTGPPYALPDVPDEAEYPLQMLTGSRVAACTGCARHSPT